jgi:5-(hydroxymethyl)furfural/furfural oxidase
METDVVIVGAGAAGCILASRLSERATLRVVLIEAGIDTPPESEPPDIRDPYPVAYSNPAYFWPGLRARKAPGQVAAPFLQAKVMGGGSAVMGMWALRGLPSDYDAWRDAGAVGWGWSDVLPSFRRLEHDLDFDGPDHGRDGPVPIRRHFETVWPGFARALSRAAESAGIPACTDINVDFRDGVFPVPVTTDNGGRVSAARGYLTAAVRARSNLRIITGAVVTHVRFDGRRATGVTIEHQDGRSETVTAAETILSAGAIYSPVLLLRSGIGPADELRRLGIEVVRDLPVGRNLQNHCIVNLAMPIARDARQAASLRTYGLACARVSADEKSPGDLLLQFIARTSPNAHGDRLGIVGVALYTPASRGIVRLAAADWRTFPHIDFNLLADAHDRQRLSAGIGLALRLLDHADVRAIRGPVVGITPGSLVRRLNRPDALSRFMSIVLAGILDGPAMLRDFAMRQAGIMVGRTEVGNFDAETLLPYASPIFHPAGTCRLGAAGDPDSVVDPSCRVLGVGGLSVIDASIMPKLPAANTCIPTMMIAEHAATIVAGRI